MAVSAKILLQSLVLSVGLSASAQHTIPPTLDAFQAAAASGGNFKFSGPGTIVVPSPVSFNSNTAIDADGHTVTLSGNGQSAILVLQTNTELSLRGLLLADGLSRGSGDLADRKAGSGGAIRNLGGKLIIQNCTFSNNVAVGALNQPSGSGEVEPVSRPEADAAGGAIWQIGGDLIIHNSTFVTNTAATSLGSIAEGFGGAIFITGANQLQISNSFFLGNLASVRSGGNFAVFHSPGLPAAGGAIYAIATDTLFTGGSLVTNGAGNVTGPSFGGAIYFADASLTLSNTLASGNIALGGNYGDRVATTGLSGLGGAFYLSGDSKIVNSAFLTNTARGGTSRNTPPSNGRGGAIYNSGTLSLVNITAAANISDASYVDIFGRFALGPDEGAVLFSEPSASVSHATIVGNEKTLSPLSSSNKISIKNSLFDDNSFNGSVNAVVDAGHNLSSGSWPSFTQATSTNNLRLKLGPLGYYGSSLPIFPLDAGSPAINSGDASAFPPTDQRGRPRPFGAGPDIGAFESSPPFFVWGKLRGRLDPTIITIGGASFPVAADGSYFLGPLPAGENTATFSASNAVFFPNPWLFNLNSDAQLSEVSSFLLHTLNYDGTIDQPLFRLAGLPGEVWTVEASIDLQTWGNIGNFTLPSSGLVTIPTTNNTPYIFLRVH